MLDEAKAIIFGLFGGLNQKERQQNK